MFAMTSNIDIFYQLEESHNPDDAAVADDLKLEQEWADVYLHNYINYLPVHLFANRYRHPNLNGRFLTYRSELHINSPEYFSKSRSFGGSISVPIRLIMSKNDGYNSRDIHSSGYCIDDIF
jgi:hypothetical protein